MAEPMLIIGLTGGIGSGKSTVADMFSQLGVPIIDTDVIARELVQKGSPLLAQITEHFGQDITGSDGQLDRSELRQRIFDSPREKKWLESLLHPAIRTEVRQRLAQLNSAYCIVVIPLLFESGQRDLVDSVLVVDTTEDIQVQRAVTRDQSSEESIRKIVASQAARQQRLAGADFTITNDADMESLQHQVLLLHEKFLKLIRHTDV